MDNSERKCSLYWLVVEAVQLPSSNLDSNYGNAPIDTALKRTFPLTDHRLSITGRARHQTAHTDRRRFAASAVSTASGSRIHV